MKRLFNLQIKVPAVLSLGFLTLGFLTLGFPAVQLSVAAQQAQTPAPAATAVSATPAAPVPTLISPGDLLEISVYDNPELSQQLRVEEGGTVNLALIGAEKLSGLTAQQASSLIADELTKRHFLVSAQVTILIEESATQGVSITGEVTHPGVYPMLATRTVLDAISLAGGLTSMADTSVTIKHRSGSEERVTVNLKVDEAESSLNQNALVYPGDLVFVPRAGIVYVLGDVGKPGGFVMQDNGRITLLQALAQAGGMNYTAKMNDAYLMHKGENGYAPNRIKVGDLVKGKTPDIQLTRDDILYIPTSQIKHLSQDGQSMVSAAAGAAVYHVVP